MQNAVGALAWGRGREVWGFLCEAWVSPAYEVNAKIVTAVASGDSQLARRAFGTICFLVGNLFHQ
jgi:hypothetical protein